MTGTRMLTGFFVCPGEVRAGFLLLALLASVFLRRTASVLRARPAELEAIVGSCEPAKLTWPSLSPFPFYLLTSRISFPHQTCSASASPTGPTCEPRPGLKPPSPAGEARH